MFVQTNEQKYFSSQKNIQKSVSVQQGICTSICTFYTIFPRWPSLLLLFPVVFGHISATARCQNGNNSVSAGCPFYTIFPRWPSPELRTFGDVPWKYNVHPQTCKHRACPARSIPSTHKKGACPRHTIGARPQCAHWDCLPGIQMEGLKTMKPRCNPFLPTGPCDSLHRTTRGTNFGVLGQNPPKPFHPPS